MADAYEYQRQVRSLLTETKKNLLVVAPTGAGKTESGFDGLEWAGGKGVYVAPTRALCHEKSTWLRERFPKARVVVGNKDYALTIGGFRESHLRVLTPWKLGVVLHNDPNFGKHCPLVVVDEIHNLDPETELIITKMKKLYPNIRVVGLSATIHEEDEPKLASWLGAVTVKSEERPVPLVPRVVHFDPDIDEAGEEVTHATFLEGVEQIDNRGYSGMMNSLEQVSAIVDYIRESGDDSPIIIYTPYQERARRIAEMFANDLGEDEELSAAAQTLPAEASDFTNTLKDCLSKGVGIHHGGMTTQERELVFRLALEKKLPVVVTCLTLTQGVNLPARHVIVESVYVEPRGEEERRLMDTSLFWQAAGRVGRPQFDSIGYVWISVGSQIELVEVEEVLLKHKASKIVSRIYDNYFLTTHVAGLIQLGYSTPAKLVEFIRATFFGATLSDQQPLLNQFEKIIGRLIEEGFALTVGRHLVLTNRGHRLARLGMHPDEYKTVEALVEAENVEYETWARRLIEVCGEYVLKTRKPTEEEIAEVVSLGMTSYVVKSSWVVRQLADYLSRVFELTFNFLQFNKVEGGYQKNYRREVADRFLFGRIEFARRLARVLPRPAVKRVLRNFGPNLEIEDPETGERRLKALSDLELTMLAKVIWGQSGIPRGSEFGRVAGLLGVTEAKLRRLTEAAMA
ncbi:MAG: DEAD/DEAH box helicase [Chloroflexi bacterium]|nr:DEAD/DEAH box helicase [Chloroflexota bacterium]